MNGRLPSTGPVSPQSCTEDVVTVASAIGSLNTTTTAAFRATSVLLLGSVRMTLGGRMATTWASISSVFPLSSLTVTRRVSPVAAPIGTGSKPPSTIRVNTEAPVATLSICANVPPGTLPGGSETYATLSRARSAFGTPAIRLVVLTDGAGWGSETVTPVSGGLSSSAGLLPLSQQALNQAVAPRTNTGFAIARQLTMATSGHLSPAPTSVKGAQKNGCAVAGSRSAAR